MTPAIEQTLPLEAASPSHSLRVIYRAEPCVAALALVVAAPALLAVAAIIAILARRTPLVRPGSTSHLAFSHAFPYV